MKKVSMKTDDQDIPEYTREQLGKGVRGKYAAAFARASNVVIIDPSLTKIFPNSEAVNNALRGFIEVASLTTGINAKAKTASRKRTAA
jgi:hypothetical protein